MNPEEQDAEMARYRDALERAANALDDVASGVIAHRDEIVAEAQAARRALDA